MSGPAEIGGLSRWADLLTTVTYSLIPLECSPRHPHAIFLSLYIRTLFLPWFYVDMFVFYIFTSLSSAVFHSLLHTSHVFTLFSFNSPPRVFAPSFAHRTLLRTFPPTTTHEYPVFLFYLYLCSPSFVLPTLQPHSPLIQSQYLQHNSVLSLQRHTTPPHLFPPSPLPHQPLTQQPHFTSNASQYP